MRHLGELRKKEKLLYKEVPGSSHVCAACTPGVKKKRLELHVHFSNVFVVSAILGLEKNKTKPILEYRF